MSDSVYRRALRSLLSLWQTPDPVVSVDGAEYGHGTPLTDGQTSVKSPPAPPEQVAAAIGAPKASKPKASKPKASKPRAAPKRAPKKKR